MLHSLTLTNIFVYIYINLIYMYLPFLVMVFEAVSMPNKAHHTRPRWDYFVAERNVEATEVFKLCSEIVDMSATFFFLLKEKFT